MHIKLHIKYPLFMSDFNEIDFSRQIFENNEILNFMKIRPMPAELFHADRRMERQSLFVILRRNLTTKHIVTINCQK